MKISKSLLQAILIGATVGTTMSSCSMFDSLTGDNELVCTEEVCVEGESRDGSDGGDTCFDCPGCGMG